MKLLDKYIISKFLTAFFFTVVLLVSVICVIDYTEKNDDFIHHNLTFGQVFTQYYIYLFPYFANLLSVRDGAAGGAHRNRSDAVERHELPALAAALLARG
jgi:hypothetical protein